MNEQNHTPEPWFWSEKYGEICFTSMYDDQSYGMSCPVDMKDESNARRIVACVNACAGIPSHELEQANYVHAYRKVLKDALTQRNELLAALEQSKLLECDFTEITHADKSKELKCSCEGFMRRVRVVRAHHQ